MKPLPPNSIITTLKKGVVIPAHPLALDKNRKFDERHQRALTRYYCAAGAGGLAVGVHTTQFAIRNHEIGLFRPVLELAAETMDEFDATAKNKLVRVAGIIGQTPQALKEAEMAASLGYHLGLVNLGALQEADNSALIEHLNRISEIIAIFGFYLHEPAGGRILDFDFWQKATEIENLLAIKIAAFNRYHTLDVMRAVSESGRAGEITLYTGNDDAIVFDLLSDYQFRADGPRLRITGGLLGHWAVWTKPAVELLERIHTLKASGEAIPADLLVLAQQVTDANAVFFDAANHFKGCIAGIQDILVRQGLVQSNLTLSPATDLSPGQPREIQRVCAAYPHLLDDPFVKTHLEQWLS